MKMTSTVFEFLWDGMMLGACLVHADGTLLQMNRAGSKILGWGVAFPANTCCHDVMGCVVPSSSGDNLVCPFSGSLVSEKLIWVPRARLRRRNHTWCPVELKVMVMHEGEDLQYLLLFRDRSEEDSLTEESNRLASIPEESPFPIIEVDGKGILRYANNAMIDLMENAQVGQDGFSTALPAGFARMVHRCLSQGLQEDNLEVQVGTKQISWMFSPHPDLGIIRGYGIDITERKKAADELSAFADTLEVKNQELDSALIKAEAATRAKAVFLATMSHEIRTPLNGVIGMAEILLNSPLDHEQQECLSIIRKAGEGLLEVINDILDFSKIESGNLRVEHILFNPRQVLEEVVDLYAERAYRKGVDLVEYVDPDVPSRCWGDPHRIRQILNNFLSNALKFTSKGFVRARIEVQPWQDSLSQSLEGKQKNTMILRFSVQDTGIGIVHEIQERIFQVFTQADSSTSRKFGGTGLGLAICHQLAQLMSGTVGVESQPDRGSLFWCHLPLLVEESRENQEQIPFPNIQRAILIASRLEGTTWALTKILNDRGVRVFPVESLNHVQALLDTEPAFHSSNAGLIVDESVNDQALQDFFERLSHPKKSTGWKFWRLQPFWKHKRESSLHDFSLEILTVPLHRGEVLEKVCGQEYMPREKRITNSLCSSFSQEGESRQEGHSNASDKPSPGPSILVVEDNPVNQRVAVGMLRKLGCQVRVVDRGDKAIQVLQQETFDGVIMDWEMPVMDGLETTIAIRKLEAQGTIRIRSEKPNWKHSHAIPLTDRMPIIGMTANVLPEDMQECLRSGMDDCLSKPAHLGDFQRILDRWVGYKNSIPLGQPQSRTPLSIRPSDSLASKEVRDQMSSIIDDVEEALRALDGDDALLKSLFGIFSKTAPELLVSLNQAFREGNQRQFLKSLHQLKGSCGAMQAFRLKDMVENLEQAVFAQPMSNLENPLATLEEEVRGMIDQWTRYWTPSRIDSQPSIPSPGQNQ